MEPIEPLQKLPLIATIFQRAEDMMIRHLGNDCIKSRFCPSSIVFGSVLTYILQYVVMPLKGAMRLLAW